MKIKMMYVCKDKIGRKNHYKHLCKMTIYTLKIKIFVQIYEKIRSIYQSQNICNYVALRYIVY